MQFYPEDWMYAYFRYNEKQTVMVVMNPSNDEKTLDSKKFTERTNAFVKAKILQCQHLSICRRHGKFLQKQSGF